MTENEIKEMLKDIIDNGAEYEYTFKDFHGDYVPWKKYNLGEEICNYYEFRKVENWSVIEWEDTHKFEIRPLKEAEDIIGAFIQITFKTKDECEKWIEENTKKTWMEEAFPYPKNGDVYEWCVANSSRNGASEVCKNILEEVKIKNIYLPFGNRINYFALEEIIKDLGVEV